jgi:hypothetical protein
MVKVVAGGLIEAHRFNTKKSFTIDSHEVTFLFKAKTYDSIYSYTLFVKDLGVKTILDLLIDGEHIIGDFQQAPRCAAWIIPSLIVIVVLVILNFVSQ